jgi:hypothetical protein
MAERIGAAPAVKMICALFGVWCAVTPIPPLPPLPAFEIGKCYFLSTYPNPNEDMMNVWEVPCDYPPNGPDPGAVYWKPRLVGHDIDEAR